MYYCPGSFPGCAARPRALLWNAFGVAIFSQKGFWDRLLSEFGSILTTSE